MLNKRNLVIGLLILAVLVFFANNQFNTLSQERVEALAKSVITENNFNVDPQMVVTMAKIESDFNKKAYRYEPHKNDASTGLMQTLLSTAQWLATDMGYNRYGVPTKADLQNPKKSIYYGSAYVNWLRTKSSNEQWVVESYNGGPGNSNSQTMAHWAKYKQAKKELFGG